MNNKYDHLHSVNTQQEYTRSYDIRYIAEIRHLGLKTHRVFKDLDKYILENKVSAQFIKWDEQWSKIESKNKLLSEKEANLNDAELRTKEAQKMQKSIEDILTHTLQIDDSVNWDMLKDFRAFTAPNPKDNLQNELSKISNPPPPIFKVLPMEPNKESIIPTLSFWDKAIKSRGKRKIERAENEYSLELAKWNDHVTETNNFNKWLQEEYDKTIQYNEKQKDTIRLNYDALEKRWQKQKDEYLKSQANHNSNIDKMKLDYFELKQDSVIHYCELVLNNSTYIDTFPKDFEIDYQIENKKLLVEYILPGIENIPSLTEVKYITTKKELKETHLSDAQIQRIYDDTIYKITLRTLHELFEADKANAIELIVFNGWVDSVSKATGKNVINCIVSIQVLKSDFLEIDLSKVDPKACFKNLKGIGSSKLHGITAIQPIDQINKNDKRFVHSYDVVNKLTEGENLAAMDWEDFEHLLREIFEKEFKSNGGEVKVTQASRDGGVDAIAFDPDPIRGGKIIIQAKRYTNTVGVSAVRDLFGTVMNEGATKGILVTTSDYGSDAYEFAKNKPITLMNGANLLYLLEKHGHKARIDIAEARRMFS